MPLGSPFCKGGRGLASCNIDDSDDNDDTNDNIMLLLIIYFWPLWLGRSFIYRLLNAADLRSRCHDGKVVTVAVNGDDTSLVPPVFTLLTCYCASANVPVCHQCSLC